MNASLENSNSNNDGSENNKQLEKHTECLIPE